MLGHTLHSPSNRCPRPPTSTNVVFMVLQALWVLQVFMVYQVLLVLRVLLVLQVFMVLWVLLVLLVLWALMALGGEKAASPCYSHQELV